MNCRSRNIYIHIHICTAVYVLSRVQLWNPMDCSPLGSSLHGIFQARILEWVAISSLGDLPDWGTESMSPAFVALAGGFSTTQLPGKPVYTYTFMTECWRIDAFELWCWRTLLRVPWTARRSNQSVLKEIIPEYSLEGIMLKLKLQDFGHLMWRDDSLEKTLMLGKTEGGRRRVLQRIRW